MTIYCNGSVPLAALSFMIEFQYPELFALALPLGWLYWRYGRTGGLVGVLRVLILLCVVFALAGTRINVGGNGLDVILVVDRSKSLPEEGPGSIAELLKTVQENRGPGDRVGVVAFGARTAIEQYPSGTETLTEFRRDVGEDGSDLNEAIEKALTLIDPDRPARIQILSDGEANGVDPISAARRAREAGVPIDYRTYERVTVGDVAIEDVRLPQTVTPGEPFQYLVLLRADREGEATLTLSEDGESLGTDSVPFRRGLTPVRIKGSFDSAGIHRVTVDLDVEDDPVPENNVGLGLVRVVDRPRVLVLSATAAEDDSGESNLTRALRGGERTGEADDALFPIDVVDARTQELTLDTLDPYRAVILENIPASALGRRKMEALARFVEETGGGLMMTGGRESYGAGGYLSSPLEPILPVSMELREEDRKLAMALAVVLDNSGSMGEPVSGELTKMDMANRGAAEAVRLLGPSDHLAVFSFDSNADEIQPLGPVVDPAGIAARVLQTQVGGGGILVNSALERMLKELKKTDGYETRHVILFSDSTDAVRNGDIRELMEEFKAANVTVSVIGLGVDVGPDADFLREVAALGNGNILFTSDPQELPRLFAEDTLNFARSTFIEADGETQPEGIPIELRSGLDRMGDFDLPEAKPIGGYNLTYLRPEASQSIVATDTYGAPIAAYWDRGLGRVVALTAEADGKYTGQFDDWGGYDRFLRGQLRWLLSDGNDLGAFIDVDRRGQRAEIVVELDPEGTAPGDPAPDLIVLPPDSTARNLGPASVITPDLVWEGPHRLTGSFRLDALGSYHLIVRDDGGEFSRGPVLSLPYSPEYTARTDKREGKDILANLAAISGGAERIDLSGVFQNPPRSPRMVHLLPWLMLAAIILSLMEIAERRLSLTELLRRKQPEPEPDLVLGERPVRKRSWLPKWRMRLPKRKTGSIHADEVKSLSNTDGPSREERRAAQRELFERAKERAKNRGR